MSRRTGFTPNVRELLKNEGPKTNEEIKSAYGHLITGAVSQTLSSAIDIHYLAPSGRGVYYFEGQEAEAKKRLEELRLESLERKKASERKYREYIEKYRHRTLPLSGLEILDVFKDCETEYSIQEIWKKRGGVYFKVARILRSHEENGTLIGVKRGGEKYYRLNPDSPFKNVANGFFEKAEKELDAALKRK